MLPFDAKGIPMPRQPHYENWVQDRFSGSIKVSSTTTGSNQQSPPTENKENKGDILNNKGVNFVRISHNVKTNLIKEASQFYANQQYQMQ